MKIFINFHLIYIESTKILIYLPFYFKIAGNESLGRKDNMVIYSSFNNLGKNI